MARLLQAGAVPDTWAPNGSSVCVGIPLLSSGKYQHGMEMTGECRTHKRPFTILLVQALMLAASVDCTEGLSLLIEHGATIELQVLILHLTANWSCRHMQHSSCLHKHTHAWQVTCAHRSMCTLLLQDALGRTALMFAAGSSAGDAVKVLLDAGASLAARDRRNKGILDYAGDDTPVRTLLEER